MSTLTVHILFRVLGSVVIVNTKGKSELFIFRVLGSVVVVNSNGESEPFDLIFHIPPSHKLKQRARNKIIKE